MDPVEVIGRLGRPAGGLVDLTELRAAGVSRKVLRRALLRGQVVRRARGLYAVPANPRPDADLYRLTKSVTAVVSHETAAAWWGLDLAHDPEGLHQLTVPANRGRAALAVPGARLHRRDLSPGDRGTRYGLPVTTPLRTVLDLLQDLPVHDGVAVADSALRKRRFTVDELLAGARSERGPRSRAVRRAASLVDPAAESVLESVLRVRLIEAGLAPPESQHVVVLDGSFLGRVDLAWPGLRVAVEADGFAFHADRESYRADRRRLSRLAATGWWVLRVSWEDVVLDPDYVVALVREALTTACAVLAQPWPDNTWDAEARQAAREAA